jgi:hypothetical protein
MEHDQPGVERQIREGLAGGVDYGKGMMYTVPALAAGLDQLALEVFQSEGMARATLDDSVRRADAMQLLPEMILLQRRGGSAPDSGRQLDDLLEWTARGLAHGGRTHDFHVVRAQALAVAGRMDEAVAEVRAAAAAVDAPFNPKEITDVPSGALLQADPRVPPILKSLVERQRKLRERLPATLAAAGIPPAEFPPLDPGPTPPPVR